MKHCQYCNSLYEPRTFNQIYCDSECTKLATNERVMERYYERKANRQGRERRCQANSCDTKLSRYNDGAFCSLHETLQDDMSFLREWV